MGNPGSDCSRDQRWGTVPSRHLCWTMAVRSPLVVTAPMLVLVPSQDELRATQEEPASESFTRLEDDSESLRLARGTLIVSCST